MAKEEYKIYSSIVPVVGHAGDTVEISVSQSLKQGAKDLLSTTGVAKVEVALQGPQLSLTDADISGVYPAAGSTDSPDNFLPHIALTRRTLPWERQGPATAAAGQPAVPWLALLVLTASDLSTGLNLHLAGDLVADVSNLKVAPVVAPIAPAPPPPAAPPVATRPSVTPVAPIIAAKPIATPVTPAAHETVIVQPVGGIVQLPQNPIMLTPVSPLQRFSSPALKTTDTTVGALKASDSKTYTQLIKIGQATAVAGTPTIVDATNITTISIPVATLKAILPAANDLALLCNAKEVFYKPDESDATYTSIVVSGRMPDAGDGTTAPAQPHMAVLVSLERRDDIYNRLNDTGSITLVALHSWTFTPSKGGDFEEVCQAIGYRPNGGVLRFGNLPKPVAAPAKALSGGFQPMTDAHGFLVNPLDHVDAGQITWRGPLRPFPPPPRSSGVALRSDPEELTGQAATTGADYSHATAFELGKLLALADAGIREDLREIHMKFNVPQGFVAMSDIPPILQQPYWGEDVGDPGAQFDPAQALNAPWSFAANQSMVGISSAIGNGNALGVTAAQAATLASNALSQLNQVASKMNAPAQGGQVGIGLQNIDTVTEVGLTATFPQLVNAGSIIEQP